MAPESLKVGVSSDFLSAFAQIPSQKQSKVIHFIQKFRSNPTMPGINYEKINVAKDPNFRSVRIDDAYRGIVFKPAKGNVYILLWVALHDDAYDWAKNKTCKVHPETGSLQIYDTGTVVHEQEGIVEEEVPSLFNGIHDRTLKRFGVPEELLPEIRKIKTMAELDDLAKQIPQEAYESLYFLAEGFSPEEIFSEIHLEKESTESIDTSDFSKALENKDSKRRFVVVEDEEDLMAMLQAPLEKWRVFLHPKQRNLVERHWNGPVRVLGGAGTGKTVAAIHRAKWLAENICEQPGDRILFTTFTRNLAADIQENLKKVCPDEALKRIEVVNLDRWVSNFLRKSGYEFDIDYGNRCETLWDQALNHRPDELSLDPTFYREEWESVIQPQGISTLQEYLQASRIGRGVRLNRKDRLQVWQVFEEYRILLNENGLKEPEDAMRDARQVIEEKSAHLPYKAVIVDEAQDMGTQAFRLIRKIVPEGQDDLFIVGDAHQRIYRQKVVLSQCGINIVGRGKKLRINYRTTDENRAWAENLLKGMSFDDLDGTFDENKGYKSLFHGVQPEVQHLDSFDDEVNRIIDQLNKLKQEGELIKSICLVARTKKLLEQYECCLKQKGYSTYRILRSAPEDRSKDGLRLATMHRVKGLEFDHMIIAGVNEDIVPLDNEHASTTDQLIARENETRERALLYVAATRAKITLFISCFGKPSKFLCPNQCRD